MKVIIKPLPKKRWHGKEGKEDFSRPKVIRALVDSKTNSYATGLTEEDIKKLKKKGVTWDLSSTYDPDNPHPFWDSKTASVTLENSTMIFDTENPLDYIKVKIMKESIFVANSYEDWERGLYPDATHYIFDEEEEWDKKAKLSEIKRKAYVKSEDLSIERKAEILQVLTGKSLRKAKTSKIQVEFDKLIEKAPDQVLNAIEMDSKKLSIKALIMEGVYKGVINKGNDGYYYEELKLGYSLEDIVDLFSKKENQELYITLMEKIL